MEDTLVTTTATPETPPKPKDTVSSHGIRVSDADWAKWQKIASAYSSNSEAFSEFLGMAELRLMGSKADMSAKTDLVADHCRQITAIVADLLATMTDQASLAAGKLADAEQRCQQQAREAKEAVDAAQAEVEAARAEQADLEQSRKALMAERDKYEKAMVEARHDLESARSLLDNALKDAEKARQEAQALRATSEHDKAAIADLRDQLATAKAALVTEQNAHAMADERMKSLTEQIGTKDRLIDALQSHLTTLGHPADSQNTTPETTA